MQVNVLMKKEVTESLAHSLFGSALPEIIIVQLTASSGLKATELSEAKSVS